MTPDEVFQRVADIAAGAGDDEGAHSSEDQLRHEVLHVIANGDEPIAAALARQALKTSEIDFARWCA